MLATTANLSGDISTFARIPVTFGSRPADYVGQFYWSGMTGDAAAVGLPPAFKSFCIEGLQAISPGSNTFDSLVPLTASTLLGSGRADQITEFWRQYGPTASTGFTDNTDGAAFQLAIWEIINDGRPAAGQAATALAGGTFKVAATHLTAPAVARAAAWLNGTGTAIVGGGAVALYALQSPTKQDQVVWGPAVDLDVDSNNDGHLDPENSPSGTDDKIEQSTNDQGVIVRPGVMVPVGGGRAEMVANVPQGRTATLPFDAAAARKVRVLSPSGAVVLDAARVSTTVIGGSPQTFWIEAFAPSATMADIAFTLTLDVSIGSGSTGSPPSDKICATAVDNAVSIRAIDDVAHERYGDTGTFVIARESGRLDTIIPVQILVSGDAGYGWQYQLNPDLPPLPVGGNDHYSTISLMPGVDRLIVTLPPLREDRDNRIRKAVLELVAPQIPLYAVTRGYDKAEVTIIPDPQQGDLQITGTITYEGPTGVADGNTLTLGALPVRGAKVEIWDENGLFEDRLVATTYTDDHGNYAVWISSVDTVSFAQHVDPFVIVVAQSAPQNIAVIAHEVSIPGESSAARKVFADNVAPRGPGSAVLNGAMKNVGDGELNAAFSVFDAIYSFSRYHVTLPNVTPATMKAQVREANSPYDKSQYSRSGEIQILLRDRFSWDTIGHEYGHFAHERAGVQLGGGEHYLSENLRFSHSHYEAAWRLAFTEGFATYFSIVAQSRTPKPPSGAAGYGDTAYWTVRELEVTSSTDIEAEGPSTPAGKAAKFGSLGEDNEVSVFRTLWDLYDPANDDPIGDIGDIGVWKLITTGRAKAVPHFQCPLSGLDHQRECRTEMGHRASSGRTQNRSCSAEG